jgi:hypothetical protein
MTGYALWHPRHGFNETSDVALLDLIGFSAGEARTGAEAILVFRSADAAHAKRLEWGDPDWQIVPVELPDRAPAEASAEAA